MVEGEPHSGEPSAMSPMESFELGRHTEIMIQSLLDKVPGPNKEKFLLGMKTWLQHHVGTQHMGQEQPRFTGTVPSAEEIKTLITAVDDVWRSFIFSMTRRIVSEENARAEHWATMLQFKEQALIEEAKAKLSLLSCQQRSGQEAGSGTLTESLQVAIQLMHQQAHMKRLVRANQAAAEDRTLLLKHLEDIDTQSALTIKLQKQAEAFQKVPDQAINVHSEVQDEKEMGGPETSAECQCSIGNNATMEMTSDQNQCLKVVMAERCDMVEESVVTHSNYDELSEEELYDLILIKHNELEETYQKAAAQRSAVLRLTQKNNPEAVAESRSVDAPGLPTTIDAQLVKQRAQTPPLPPESDCTTSAPVGDLPQGSGPNKKEFLLGMKVWLQHHVGTHHMGQLPQFTGTVPSAEEVKTFSPAVDDVWKSFMFSMTRRMVSEENARAEHWATMLQFKEQALIEEAKAKLNLLFCQQRSGQEAGSGNVTESLQVAIQLMHQQAQIKRLVRASQAAAEDRTSLLKHLADMDTHPGQAIQLQKQAEAFQKEAQRSSPQDSSRASSTNSAECQCSIGNNATMEMTSDQNQCLTVAMGEHCDMVEESVVKHNKYDTLSEEELYDLILIKHNELEETYQKAAADRSAVLRLTQKNNPEKDAESRSVDASGLPTTIDAQLVKQRAQTPPLPPEFDCTTSAPVCTDNSIEEISQDDLQCEKEAPTVSYQSNQQALDKLASPSKLRAQEENTQSIKAGQEGSEAAAATPIRQLRVDAQETLHHPAELQDGLDHEVMRHTTSPDAKPEEIYDSLTQSDEGPSDDEVLDQAIKIHPEAQDERVIMTYPEMPNATLKVTPDQDLCLDVAKQGNENMVEKSSGTLKSLGESMSESSPRLTRAPSGIIYYSSEDSDSEESQTGILKDKVVSTEKNNTLSLKCEETSSDATVFLHGQEDSEVHCENDFDVLSDEMEEESSDDACSSVSSVDDSIDSVLQDGLDHEVMRHITSPDAKPEDIYDSLTQSDEGPSDDEVLDQAIKIHPEAQDERVIMTHPEKPNATLKVTPDQDLCLDVAKQGNQNMVEKSSRTLKSLGESVSESSPQLTRAPSGIIYYSSEDSDSEESQTGILKDKVVSTECQKNNTLSLKCEETSRDATVFLHGQEDSEVHYENDFDVLSDEMEEESSDDACSSVSSVDDSIDSVLQDGLDHEVMRHTTSPDAKPEDIYDSLTQSDEAPSDDEVLDQAIKIHPEAQDERVIMTHPEMLNATLKVTPDQDLCLDVVKQGNENMVEKSSRTLKSLGESVSESSPQLTRAPSGIIYYSSEDSDSEESQTGILKDKVVSTEKNNTLSLKCDETSSDATVFLHIQEDSEVHCENDFDVLSDEMEEESSDDACSSVSRVDDSIDSVWVEDQKTLHHPAEVEMLVNHAVQEIWQVFHLQKGPKDLSGVPCPKPSQHYLEMVHPEQDQNAGYRDSYNKLIFHLSWETLQDLCAKDPTTQPMWKKSQPEHHNYVEKLKSFNDLSKVKEYVTEEVLNLCGLKEEKDVAVYGKIFAYNYRDFKLTKFDQMMLRELPEEEHKWLDQDKEAFDVKNKYAKVVFDHLVDDTLKCLLGCTKKTTKKS